MANSQCRTWSGSSLIRSVRARRALVVSLVVACAWLCLGASVQAQSPRGTKDAKQAEASERRERQRKRKAQKRRRAAQRDQAEAEAAAETEREAELEPGDALPVPAQPSTEQAGPALDAAASTSSASAEPPQGTGERETIDLGEAASERETIELGDASAPEVIDLGPSTSSSTREPEAEQLDFQLRGWGRTRANQTWLGNQAVAPDGVGVPYEPTLLEQQLFLEVRYAKNRWFEAVASGLLGYTIARHEEQTNGQKVDALARGLLEPSLREIYVGLYASHVSGRIGQQRIAWGNSDAFAINDVLNPRDLREPVLAETDVLHVPSMFVRLDLTGSWGALQLLVAPFFRPDQFDIYGTNWATIQPDAPLALRGAIGRLSQLSDPSLREPSQLLLRQTSLPRDDLSATSAGARFDWSAVGLNVSHYYWYGYTSSPALRIDPALLAGLAATNWQEATPADLAPLLAAAGTDALSSTYERTQHVGTSVQAAVGSFLVRAEGAFDRTRVLVTRDLLAVLRSGAQAVVGIEYQPGEDGKAIILEGLYQRILGNDPGPLLGAEVNSYGAASVVRWTFFEHLELELRAVASLSPRGALVRPQLAYKKDFWELRLGAVWIDGERGSQQHYYRRNQSGYLMAKLKF
jgi:hypothetical protein